MAVNLSFLNRSCFFPFKDFLIYPHESVWTAFQTHCYSGNLVTPGIESGTFRAEESNSDHQTTEAVLISIIRTIS
jgi:hypothetical protein